MISRAKQQQFDVAFLRETFDYVAATGVLIWKNPKHQRFGLPAGYLRTNGYVLVSLQNKKVFAHRIIWAIVHGRWPADLIDHINGVPSDNRIENLREATQTENNRNSQRQGWSRDTRGRYRAFIYLGNKQHYLGSFASEVEARAAYLAASKKHFGEFSVAMRGVAA